ncbi:MAG: RAD55 family ATPase, partial [Thermoplasmata archaeon]|nr:RAD55 family ATPase [Thermoplasmata archaeon]
MSESEIPRVPTGVIGLDEMLGGGLPAGHVVLVTGLPGTGKTCFGLQFLFAGAARGEPGVYLSLEEEEPALLASARQFGWPVEAAVKAGHVKVMRLDPKQTHQNLQRIQSDLGK